MAKMKWQAQCDSVLLELDRVLRGIEESQCALDPPERSPYYDLATEDKELCELYRNATLQAEDDSTNNISFSPTLEDPDNILLCSDQEDPTCEDIVLEEKSILSVVFNSSRSSSLKSSPSVNKRSINSDEDDNASLLSDISKSDKGGKNINNIFDNGITPPIPPKRKRKGAKESINQIYLNEIICPECNKSVCDPECLDQKLDKEICELETMKLYYEEEARKCSEANASLYIDLLYRNVQNCYFNLEDLEADSNYESSDDSPGRGSDSPYPKYCELCDSGQLSTVEEEEDEFDDLLPLPEIKSIKRGYATSSPLPFPVPDNSFTQIPPNDSSFLQSQNLQEVTTTTQNISPPCEQKENLLRKPPSFQVISLKPPNAANVTPKPQTPPPARYLPVQRDVVFWLRNIRHQCHDEDEWYASNDAEGRVYFYPENSEESAWSLPEVQKSQVNIEFCVRKLTSFR